MKTALLAGGTGLVGGKLLELLLRDPSYTRVHLLGRRTLSIEDSKLTQSVVDFAALGAAPRADDAFCALGTTIKKAGSQAAFRAVDFDAVLAFARAARASGAKRFFLVSSLGADAGSRVFYTRVKGEIERAVSGLGYEAVFLLRPSVLLGERGESRLAERIGGAALRLAGPLFLGPLRKYRAIEAATVARAALRLAREEGGGERVVESDELERLGG